MDIPKSLTTKTQFSKILTIFLFIVLPFIGFLLGAQYNANDRPALYQQPQIEQRENIEKKEDVNVRQRDFRPLDYFQLANGITETELIEFKDDFLNVSFKYPKKYYLNSVKSDQKDPSASIYFTLNDNLERRGAIDRIVECERDNRITPAGICAEGNVGDIHVGIHQTEEHELQYYSNYRYCDLQKNDSTEKKIIYSCLIGNLVGSPEYRFIIFLKDPQENMSVFVDTRDARGFGDVINTVIDSFVLL